MNIDEMTIGDFKKIATLVNGQTSDSSAWEIGKNYLIRTVTMIDTGRLVSITHFSKMLHGLQIRDAFPML